MPLIFAPCNVPLRVVRMHLDEKIKRHLENLGISVNSELEVLSVSGGSVIVRVKEGRLGGYSLPSRRLDMIKTLDSFAIGEKGVIKSVSGEGKIRRRLFDMGVTPGAEVMLRKRAPLGDPIEVTLRGYELTLRKTEAACVLTEVEE